MAKGIQKQVQVEAGKKFDDATLTALCCRWQKGEALKDLAALEGTSWQTLAGCFIAKGWKRDAAPAAKNSKPAAAQKAAKNKKAAKQAAAV